MAARRHLTHTKNFLINLSLLKAINSWQTRISVQDSGKMVDNNNSVREFLRNEFLEAIPVIRKKNKRLNRKATLGILQETGQQM